MQTFSDENYTFDVEKLWEISDNFETEYKRVSDLIEQLDYDCWGLAPIEVIGLMSGEESKHEKRIRDACMKYPIMITPNGHVCDGMHRLAKAHMSGHTMIKAKVFESWSEMLPARVDRRIV